jgi:hypothetical protein
MNPALARRQVALAGVALIGALGAIALSRIGDDAPASPPPGPAAAEWQQANVAVADVPAEPTSCGVVLGPDSLGVVHPVLPCHAKLLLENGGRQVEAEVVSNGQVPAGYAFDVTPGLAAELGLPQGGEVNWRFARP